MLWRGQQWSVTSNGIETTDAGLPHVVIPLQDFEKEHDILNGQYASFRPRNAGWFDRQAFQAAMAMARLLHGPIAGVSRR